MSFAHVILMLGTGDINMHRSNLIHQFVEPESLSTCIAGADKGTAFNEYSWGKNCCLSIDARYASRDRMMPAKYHTCRLRAVSGKVCLCWDRYAMVRDKRCSAAGSRNILADCSLIKARATSAAAACPQCGLHVDRLIRVAGMMLAS